MSYNLKITVPNNIDSEQEFTLKDSSDVAMDLTGHKLSFAVGNTHTGTAILTHVSGEASNKCIFIVNALQGQIKLVLPYTVLKRLEPDTYIHDCVLIKPDGKRVSVWSGRLVLKAGVI